MHSLTMHMLAVMLDAYSSVQEDLIEALLTSCHIPWCALPCSLDVKPFLISNPCTCTSERRSDPAVTGTCTCNLSMVYQLTLVLCCLVKPVKPIHPPALPEYVQFLCRWFDNTLFTVFRGKRCYDGGLTNFIPLPPTQHGVRVCCFPSKQITTIYDIGISPDNYEDWPHTLQEMLSWAFEPADEKLLIEFIGGQSLVLVLMM